ncbi:glutaredoxin family protein [Rugamonas sp. DEMB1]|uniref:glutaredoxin family protein n=1 Tax=Rugamonas sp. DEMB1 TaxID=3039386 RepID=UPI00244733A4|nr:glutaredoxin family protein [Rugamonas sp. DEMB1]WGG51545.1 glutaredoxin family protein [Rugamonas sp. DEMB1]
MGFKLAAILLLCAGAAGGVHAQVYKWVDEKGVTHYSDAPPPPSGKAAKAKVELKSFSGGGAAVELPAELAAAVRNRPVTLYSTAQCEACDQARAMLLARGIPFREKTVNTADDQAALKKAGSNGQLPLLLVGRGKQIGFSQDSWEVLLSDAGYPVQKILPPNYQNPPPVAAAPAPQPDATEQTRAAARDGARAAAAEEEARRRKQQQAEAPPGFQF